MNEAMSKFIPRERVIPEGERAARARLVEIENELFSPAAYTPNDILRRPDPQARVAHEQRFEALRKERESLLASLPKTGEAAGHLVLARGLLGSTIVREVPPDEPRDDGYDASDPHQRFAKEMGWSRD
jgi:hypothetical protein